MIFFKLIYNFFLMYCLAIFAKSILKPTNRRRMTDLFIFAIFAFILTVNSQPNNKLSSTFIMIIIYFLYILSFFKGPFFKKLLILILFYLVLAFSELFTANIMNILLELNVGNIKIQFYAIALLLSSFIVFLITYTLSKLFRINTIISSTKYMWSALILPFSTLLFILNFSDQFSIFKSNYLAFFVMLGLSVANIISLYGVFKSFQYLELAEKIKTTEMKYELLNLQYNTNFYFLHDTIRSLTRLSNLISEKKFAELQEKILDLNRNLTRSFNTINSNSAIISTLLNYKIQEINKHNIIVKTVIEYTDFSFIDIDKQRVLFSELIDLSILSCKKSKVEFPRIIIKTKKINEQKTILFSFSKLNDDTLEYNLIEEIIEDSLGEMSIDYNDRQKFCNILIVF